jgi:hypothetical protein
MGRANSNPERPPLVTNPHKWWTHQDDLAPFENAGYANVMALSKLNYSHDDYGFDGEILLRPAATYADTLVWNGHLADANNLLIPAGWGRDVRVEIERDFTLPLWVRGMGGVTSPVLRALRPPTIFNVLTDGNLKTNFVPAVTSFSPENAFDPNVSACFHGSNTPSTCCGHPARPMKIDTLNDGEEDWSYEYIRAAMGVSGLQGTIQHIQSPREDGRIFFNPNMQYPDQYIPQLPDLEPDPQRARYRTVTLGDILWRLADTFRINGNITLTVEMNKMTLCNPNLNPNAPSSWPGTVWEILHNYVWPSPAYYNIELPTFQDVKGDLNRGNER